MRILLVSTYELGHQPLHLASPAAALGAAGHDVVVADTAVGALDPVILESVEAVAVSVPMHTATRLANEVVEQVRRIVPEMPVALYGLYAGQGSASGVAARFVGEYEADLVGWASAGAPTDTTRVSVATGVFHVPDRSRLPELEAYGRLVVDGNERLVGYVEASHGCRHRCRHCPIPAVYDGRYRIVGADVVLADIDRQAEMGAQHITWGDPDFLNGPRHSVDLLEEVHRRHPELTHDLTIKVEHLRRHDDLLPRLAAAGTLFIVSAFESTDDRTLELLDKGHTAADMAVVVARARSLGIDIRPSWMPFVPWTVPADVVGIFRFIAENDLLGSTDPVQMSIRLLIPRGSLMLQLEEVSSVIDGYDEELLTYRWSSADPRSDELQRRFAEWAEMGADRDPVDTLVAMWREAVAASGGDVAKVVRPDSVTTGRPHLTESWFCCAEPTRSQSVTISSP
ncbi:MAG TPA: CUAEP/CCAEP-tail radical SAM protein [Acidimicrobiia bacterium]|nr:CUAEP/CCAEP-tail radical SAM protein [Acidimicrobiia bacterium]